MTPNQPTKGETTEPPTATNEDKFSYVCQVMDLKGDTESKKHGYYKVLLCGIYKLSWDSWNNTHYLQVNGASVDIEDYKEILYKAVKKKWNLPSTMEDKKFNELLDYLYMNDEKVKTFYDTSPTL